MMYRTLMVDKLPADLDKSAQVIKTPVGYAIVIPMEADDTIADKIETVATGEDVAKDHETIPADGASRELVWMETDPSGGPDIAHRIVNPDGTLAGSEPYKEFIDPNAETKIVEAVKEPAK